MSYKETFSFEDRKEESERILQKFFPARVPVIVENGKNSKELPKLEKKKFIVPSDITVAQFMYVIRKRIKLSAETALFFFVNDVVPPATSLMSFIYDTHKDADGFMYFTLSQESVFGN